MHSDKQLWRYLDGELPAAEAAALEAEAAADESLRARLDEMRAISREVLAGAPTPPPDFADKVVALARRGAAPVLDIEEARRFMKRALIAAAIIGAVGVAYLAFGLLPDLFAPDPVLADPLLGGKP